ncbi:MAG: gluconate permease [Planctomycetales bacterium]|nr:gluconate permease [Planctomycetales bacterium]
MNQLASRFRCGMTKLLSFSLTLFAVLASPAFAMAADAAESSGGGVHPLAILVIGIVAVLALIIGARLNAFLALIIAALIVSMLSGDIGGSIGNVTAAFGSSAGGIGVVIAMAAIIGKCMLDSGAADRIVRASLDVFGEKKSGSALMGSGFLLAIPVFFDTVFYLLVPLARSLFRRTNARYLYYLLAIATGGAITHTLVPPTPGPLLVGANLGVDVGMMMLIGAAVAFPSAIVGLICSNLIDKIMPIPMRPLGSGKEPDPIPEDQLPSLWVSLMPVLLPVVLISMGTIANTLADAEDRAQLALADVPDINAFANDLRADAANDSLAKRISESERWTAEERDLMFGTETITPDKAETVISGLNNVLLDKGLYSESAFLGVALPDTAKKLLGGNLVRMKNCDARRMNRLLLETVYAKHVKTHEWNSPKRSIANSLTLPSNANFALILAAGVAMWMLKNARKMTLSKMAADVEEALMSAGMIILITAAGGAFGAMLSQAKVGDEVEKLFSGSGGVGGVKLLLLAFAVAAVLKVAQGSSTVAMIVGSGIVASIASGQSLGYHPVYLGTAVGSGSLIGSWMNDSGFWVFTKMGGLTEAEGLKSWTILLLVLGVAGLGFTILLSTIMPLAG